MLNEGRLPEAWERIKTIAPVPPGGYEYLISTLLEGWISLLPEEQAKVSPFHDDPSAAWQFVPASSSAERNDRMLIVFCGMAQRFGGCPLPLMHCHLGRLGVHLLYLRDFDNLFYLNGLPSDDYNFASTIQRIRALSQQHGAERILTIGSSSGGFEALHWGLELSAERIVSLAGPTNLTRILANICHRQEERGIPTADRADSWAADAAARLHHRGTQPHFHLVHAAENANDICFAQDLGSPLPSHISVDALEGTDAHNVVIPLLERDQLVPLLMNLVGP